MSFSVVLDRYHQYNNQYQIIGDMTMTSTVNIKYSLFLHGNLIQIIFYVVDHESVFEKHIGYVFRGVIPSHHHYFTIKKNPPILHYVICIYIQQITITTQSNHPNPSQITRI